MANKMWTRENVLELIVTLEQALAPIGYHIALAGSVLVRGQSPHDLDVLIFPHDSTIQNKDAVRRALGNIGWARTHSSAQMLEHWRSKGSQDCKFVEVWRDNCNRRIDIIYVS